MKILITGGHFSPALSLIEALPKNVDVAVVGRKYIFEGDRALSYEYTVCKERKIPFFSIHTARLQRAFTRYTIPALARVPISFYDALWVIKKWKPDVVVVFGGYLALPVAISSRVFNIPIIVHEQTMEAGLANKIIGKFAEKVCISFATSRKFFPKEKIVMTGNPIRRDVFSVVDKIPLPENKKIVYVTGGSSGSHAINMLIGAIISRLVKDFIVIHQTGDSQTYKDFNALSAVRSELPKSMRARYILKKFVHSSEIGFVLSKSDLVISRAGINTVCELMVLKKPCLFIPLPTGQKNEQLMNAQYATRVGIGEYIAQDAATPEKLYTLILKMVHEKEKYENLYIDAHIREDGDKRLLDVIQSIYEVKKEKVGKAKIQDPGKL